MSDELRPGDEGTVKVAALRTEAGRHLRRLLLDLFQAWQQYADVEPIEDPRGLILAIEAEAATPAADDALRAAIMEKIRGWVEPNMPGPPGPDRVIDFDHPEGIHVDEPEDIPLFLDAILSALAQQRSEPVGLDVERLADDVRYGAEPQTDYWRGFNAGIDAILARLSDPQP